MTGGLEKLGFTVVLGYAVTKRLEDSKWLDTLGKRGKKHSDDII